MKIAEKVTYSSMMILSSRGRVLGGGGNSLSSFRLNLSCLACLNLPYRARVQLWRYYPLSKGSLSFTAPALRSSFSNWQLQSLQLVMLAFAQCSFSSHSHVWSWIPCLIQHYPASPTFVIVLGEHSGPETMRLYPYNCRILMVNPWQHKVCPTNEASA
jgi:hypothetical protein